MRTGIIVNLLIIMAASVLASAATPSSGKPALSAGDSPDQSSSAATPRPPQPDLAAADDRDEIVVQARRHHGSRADPLAVLNEKTFFVAQDVDRAIVGPVALGYARAVPRPV